VPPSLASERIARVRFARLKFEPLTSRLGQVYSAEIRARYLGGVQVCSTEIGAAEIRVAEVRTIEHGVAEGLPLRFAPRKSGRITGLASRQAFQASVP
jgi:hypothetical protein